MSVDWTNARYADGRKVWEWLEAHDLLGTARAQGDWAQELVKRWEHGTQSSFWTVDRLLVAIRRHVSQLPAEVWQAERTWGGKTRSREAVAA